MHCHALLAVLKRCVWGGGVTCTLWRLHLEGLLEVRFSDLIIVLNYLGAKSDFTSEVLPRIAD